uniref:Uncharacterized protein n=1 Tax=Arundo donax TaxID=35708 RepID=A0A0A9A2S4_ARUDO
MMVKQVLNLGFLKILEHNSHAV